MSVYSVTNHQTGAFVLTSGDSLFVVSGGESLGSTIHSGAIETVFETGHSLSDTVSAGGVLSSLEGYVQAATVLGELVVFGGHCLYASVSSGGYLEAYTTVSSATVMAGGSLELFGHAKGVDTIVDSGAAIYADVSISKGETSSSHPITATTTIDGATVMSGAVLRFDEVRVLEGGTLILNASDVVENVTISSGTASGSGELVSVNVDSGGLVSGVEVAGGGALDVFAGKVIGLRIGGADGSGTLNLQGSLASSIVVGRGGMVSVGMASAGGALSGASVLSGGKVIVSSDGLARATTLLSAGDLVLSGGGVGSAATVYAGGLLTGSGYLSGSLEGLIADRGVVDAATVISGGRLDVMSGGRATLIEADSAGVVVIASGGVGSNVTTVFGGALVNDGVVAYSVSNAIGADLSGDGEILQRSGGALYQSGDAAAFTGKVVIAGGAVVLESAHGFGAAPFVFAPAAGLSARLELLSPATPATGGAFAEALSNFSAASDSLDLRRKAFVAGATASVSGSTLTLVDGGYTARFTLTGAKPDAYVVTSDVDGGTLIAAASAPAALAQALAGFDAARPPSAILTASASDGGHRGLQALAPAHAAGAHTLPAA